MNVRSVVLLALFLVLSTFATAPKIYCQAEDRLYVIYVDGNPQNVASGDKFTIFFDVIYYVPTLYCGNISRPAIGLKSASFRFSNATTLITLTDVPIYPTKSPGQYTVTFDVKPDYPSGKVTVYVDENSLRILIEDVHYSGPAAPVSSIETEDQSDYSIYVVVAPTPTPTPTPTPMPGLGSGPWVFPLIVIIVIVGAILVYFGFRVSRKRK